MTPLYVFRGPEPTTKVERLRREGTYIYEREATMNQRGVPGGGDVVRKVGEVFFGKRRRTGMVIRFRRAEERATKWFAGGDVETGRYLGGMDEATDEQRRIKKEERGHERAKAEAGLRAMAARLSRRPWKPSTDDDKQTKTIQSIQSMKETELRNLIRVVMIGFDQTGRSIAKANIKVAMRGRSGAAWIFGKTRSPLLGDRGVKSAVDNEIKRWSSRMRCNEKKTVILEHQGVATTTTTTMREMNNTEEMSKKRRSGLTCE